MHIHRIQQSAHIPALLNAFLVQRPFVVLNRVDLFLSGIRVTQKIYDHRLVTFARGLTTRRRSGLGGATGIAERSRFPSAASIRKSCALNGAALLFASSRT